MIEAIEAGRAIDKILFQTGASGDVIGKIRQLAKQHNIPIQVVPPEKLNTYSRAKSPRCIALAALVQYMDLQQVMDHVIASGAGSAYSLCWMVLPMLEISVVSRVPQFAAAHRLLIIPDKGVGALNEEAMKSSAGALEKIQVCRVGSLLKAIDDLHLNGIQVFVSEMKGSKKLHEIDFKAAIMYRDGQRGQRSAVVYIKSCR